MDPKQIAHGYDQLAERWAAESFPRENAIRQHERAVAFLKNKRSALDVGCGSSGRIVDYFLSQGFAVEGVDISEKMLTLARKKHPLVTFHHADICEWNLPHQYDFISAWDSIWHVPLARQENVLKKLIEGLEPDGVLIFTTGGVDTPSEKTDSYMGPEMYYGALGIPHLLALLDSMGCVCRHLEYDQHPELHVYMIAQKSR